MFQTSSEENAEKLVLKIPLHVLWTYGYQQSWPGVNIVYIYTPCLRKTVHN